ncbi:MAG: ABC transporter permease [Bacteroidales bacterium]|nr:ABC transporter permease [Bacteroidales bacterium]
MKTILIFIQKEFLQIFRNRAMLPMIFMMPIIQLLILGNAATFEMKNIRMEILDQDLSPASRELSSRFMNSPFFEVSNTAENLNDCEQALDKGAADCYLVLPEGFERDLVNMQGTEIQLVLNAINASSASLINAYCNAIAADYVKSISGGTGQKISQIESTYSYWFNPEMNYPSFMVPGILVLLVTLIGLFLSSMNIVREKEIGTIEQINITPVKKYQFIAGKLIPFWIIAQVELAIGLLIAWLLYRIPIEGSLLLLFGFTAIYLVAVLSLGLLVSTINKTQQQAMFVSWFFMMLFIILSGLFTPVDSMPAWAQSINLVNPIKYFIEFIRMVLLKGSGFEATKHLFIIMSSFAAVLLPLAMWMYKKTE